ncbi:MAG TPA: hypothetical protein VIL85_01115 [Thermomicrobiales bacterium]|jgi:hypothetical protein
MNGRNAAITHPVTELQQPADVTDPATALAAAKARTRGRAMLRFAALTIAYTLLTIFFTWPIVTSLSNHIADYGDPVDSAWRLSWGQHQLLHDPLHLFDSNVFYPYARSYLFDELLLGIAIITLPLRLFTDNPIAIYNLAMLSTFVFSALAMYALARRLRCTPVAAFAAGLIYAFAPLHMAHLTHLGLLSGQYFPLAILLLDRIFDRNPNMSSRVRWRDTILLAVVLALQALSAQYYAFYLILVIGGFVGLRLVQEGAQRRFPSFVVWARLLTAGVLAGLIVAPFFLGYRTVQGDYTVERSIAQNAYYSANLASFFTADGQNLIWGTISAPLREFGRYTFERNMFPGLIALLLSIVGLVVGWRRPLAQYLFLLGVGAATLALGPNLYITADNKSILFTRMPYGFLYFHLPGFDSMRVPARMGILFGLSVAGLAAIGLTWLLGKAAAWQPARPRLNGRVLAAALAVVLIAGIGAESLNRPYTPVPLATREEAPPVYRWLATQPDAVVLELPFVIPDHPDQTGMLGDLYQYYALYHGRPVVNGSANVLPKGYKALYYELRAGPTPRALSILQGLGVNSLVVHYDELSEEVAAKTRELLDGGTTQAHSEISFGNDTVYRIAPTDRFAQLRSLIPGDASIYLSRGEDPTGAYGGMLVKVLLDNPVYTRVRVEFGRDYISTLDPNARYDYAILYHYENPADIGFAGAPVVWEDAVVRIYGRNAAR